MLSYGERKTCRVLLLSGGIMALYRHKVVVHGLVSVCATAGTDSGAFQKRKSFVQLLLVLVHGLVFDESDKR